MEEESCPICGARMIYPEGDTGFAVCPSCGYVGQPRVVYLPPRKIELPRYRPHPSKYAVAVRDLARQLGIRSDLVNEAAEVARRYGSGFPPYVVAAATLYLFGLISYGNAAKIVPSRLLWNAICHLKRRGVGAKRIAATPLAAT